MKGISPIISIIILLLITVSLAASAWTYISGYWGGLVSTGVEVSSTICSSGTSVRIYVHNIGTSNMNMISSMDIDRIQGSSTLVFNKSTLTYDPVDGTVGPGETGKIVDVNCTEPGVQQRCAYDIVHSPTGRLYQAYTTCYG